MVWWPGHPAGHVFCPVKAGWPFSGQIFEGPCGPSWLSGGVRPTDESNASSTLQDWLASFGPKYVRSFLARSCWPRKSPPKRQKRRPKRKNVGRRSRRMQRWQAIAKNSRSKTSQRARKSREHGDKQATEQDQQQRQRKQATKKRQRQGRCEHVTESAAQPEATVKRREDSRN